MRFHVFKHLKCKDQLLFDYKIGNKTPQYFPVFTRNLFTFHIHGIYHAIIRLGSRYGCLFKISGFVL